MQQDIYDPLLDEGKAFSDRLDAAGVPVLYECFEGMAHGFLIMGSARVKATLNKSLKFPARTWMTLFFGL